MMVKYVENSLKPKRPCLNWFCNAFVPMNDPLEWYYEIPPISRLYLSGAFLTTVACQLDLISPFALYYNFNLIFYKGQIWRLLTNFLFFGTLGLDFLFHMYFLVRYCRLLEEGSFRGKSADFLFMLLFGGLIMSAIAPFISIHFLGSPLAFMMVYVWGRRNINVRMSLLGMFNFTAPYLPWVLLSFSVAVGSSILSDVLGIFVGHVYYFMADIYPLLADKRGWRRKKIMITPRFIRCFFEAPLPNEDEPIVLEDHVDVDNGGHLHEE